ncbi:hypothetical protein E1B06_13175 [Brevibacillus laterosporus]|uniref:hypothetical protein n=1 Tax=Brevibacillus laterosporus TaxID=1465 RepID=UPI002406CB3B|nr:hypothetical protein [Brevibacillus laterosporus]MDF9412645.1 hypothetical protein [Brevibacillus laterosporus]
MKFLLILAMLALIPIILIAVVALVIAGKASRFIQGLKNGNSSHVFSSTVSHKNGPFQNKPREHSISDDDDVVFLGKRQ